MSKTYFPIISKDNYKLPLYLFSVGVNFEESKIVRPYGYPVYQWIQCSEGEGKFIYKDKEYIITPNTGIFIYPNDKHEYFAVKKPWITNWVTFDGCNINTLLKSLGFTNTYVYNVKNTYILKSNITKCLHIAVSNNPISNLECSSHLYSLLIELMKHIEPLENESLYQRYSKLEPILNFIDENYDKTITIDELANIINVTPQYLCLLFKKYLYRRPFEYINVIRINKSKRLMLNNPNMLISEIGKKVGFDNPSYFGQQFKKFEGMTPGQFKELYT